MPAESFGASAAAHEVIVVGGGPVGLASAIELGMRGIKVLLIERNTRAGTAPRAKTTNVRTRTHLRRWGIANRLAEESPFGVDYPNNMVFVTRLAGFELARFANAFNASPERSPLYPEHAQWVPQYTLEKVLLEKARTLPTVAIRFETVLLDARQDTKSVVATIGPQEAPLEVRGRYLIGADGARSRVREVIGAKMVGRSGLSHHYNIIFRAPGLAQAHKHGPAAIYWQMSKSGLSAIGPMDRDDRWFFGPGGAKPGLSLSHDEAKALIRERTGIDLPYEILSADTWTANELLADRYGEGRIFLAGDACHLHPPAGGYGMNMGIGDAVDLGWKIAATLQGWGGPGLLANYDAERRPVHRFVMDEAMANYASYVAPSPPAEIEDDTPEGAAARARVGEGVRASKWREFHTLGTVLGLCLQSPLIVVDDEPPPLPDSQGYQPSTRAGCLAPHAWLADGSSLYDHFGDGFTLVSGRGVDAGVRQQAAAEAGALGAPLATIDLSDEDPAAVAPYQSLFVVVRPDQHVAWRGRAWQPGLLRTLTGFSVGRDATEDAADTAGAV
jgi:2-polyprenyl-6-methoxyphenol hydroxylase-like FAD-dependent oxidoreductase